MTEQTGGAPLPAGQPGHLRLAEAYSLYQLGMMMAGLRESDSRFVGGEGSLQAPVVVVGEAPGKQEDRVCRPFVGPSGDLLNKLLQATELRRAHCFITNVVKYWPRDFTGRTRPPFPHEITASVPCLQEEVAVVRPLLVITLGAVATRALIPGAGPMKEEAGLPRGFGHDGQWILPLYHPSACLRDPDIRARTFCDILWMRPITCAE